MFARKKYTTWQNAMRVVFYGWNVVKDALQWMKLLLLLKQNGNVDWTSSKLICSSSRCSLEPWLYVVVVLNEMPLWSNKLAALKKSLPWDEVLLYVRVLPLRKTIPWSKYFKCDEFSSLKTPFCQSKKMTKMTLLSLRMCRKCAERWWILCEL